MQDQPRKFSVIQAMMLVAAIAPGLAMTRQLPVYLGTRQDFDILNEISVTPTGTSFGGWMLQFPGPGFTNLGRPLHRRPSYWLGHIPYWGGPCLACWSLAMIGLSWRSPGPRAGRPGFAVGLAVAIASGVQAARLAMFRAASPSSPTSLWDHPEPYLGYFWIGLPRVAGFAVAVWWLALSLSGRRSVESRAGDWPGRALGWCWIAAAASSEVGTWCYTLNY